MVFYFSGTGNSKLVAKRIAQITGDELVSINDSLRAGERKTFHSERPLVFVAPTYCWRMPKVVARWMEQNSFAGSRDAYFALTCAGNCGNAAAYIKQLCARKGLRFCGLSPVVMPENYLAMFPTPGEAECQAIVERAKPAIAALAAQIQSGQRLGEPPVSLGDRLASGPLNPLFYALFVRDRGFHASERCVSCGHCARTCPLHDIELANGKPRWKGNCTHCMACIAGCPTEAIEYRAKTKGRHRHYIMDDASR